MAKSCKLSSYYFSSLIPLWEADLCEVPNDVPEAKYCERHGCRVCKFVKPKKGVINELGEEFCSDDCKRDDAINVVVSKDKKKQREKQAKKDKKWREGVIIKVEEKYNILQEKLKERYTSLYEKIENIDLGKLKRVFIEGKINLKDFLDHWHSVIENSSLERTEKDHEKKFIQKVIVWQI